jgi:hypothetical protein
MINFRFHVLSLVAVFAAVALGLVVGTAALNGPDAEALRGDVAAEQARNRERNQQIDRLTADATSREEFAEQLAPFVLADRLGRKRVLVLSAGAAPADVDSVATMLRVARASVIGPVTVADRFVDPLHSAELLDTALTALPPSVTAGLPATADGVTASAALLAAVLVNRTPAVAAQDRRSVLAAYTDLGYLTGADINQGADAVVVIAGQGASGGPDRTEALLRALVEFDRAGPLVVVSAQTAPAGGPDPVDAVRGNPDLASSISTVDNIGTPHGRLVVAWAVADELAGTVGHYGTGAGATLVPGTGS